MRVGGDATLRLDDPLAAEIAAGLTVTTTSDGAFERGQQLIVDGLRASLRKKT